MGNIRFRLKDKEAKQSVITVDCRYRINGYKDRARFSVLRSIEPKHWNFKYQRPSYQSVDEKHIEIKKHLDKTVSIIEDFLTACLKEQKMPTKDEIQNHWLEMVSPKVEEIKEDFLSVYHKFIAAQKDFNEHRTIQKYEGLLKGLMTYSIKSYTPSIKLPQRPKYDALLTLYMKLPEKEKLVLEEINSAFDQSYRKFLLDKGDKNDTIAKNFSTLKTFMAWAFDKGYHNVRDFEKFKAVKSSKLENFVLTEEQLKSLYVLQLADPLLNKVKDLFCFMAYTGQRWEDYERFNPSDVKQECWTFYISKTKAIKQTKVPLQGVLSPASEILKKYDGNLPVDINGKFFTLNRFNDLVKLACKESGLLNDGYVRLRYSGKNSKEERESGWQFVSQYTARRTFCTIMANKIPLPSLMLLTGHTKLTTLYKYINTDFKSLVNSLESANS